MNISNLAPTTTFWNNPLGLVGTIEINITLLGLWVPLK